MISGVAHSWRGPVSGHEVVAFVADCGGDAEKERWDRLRPLSLGWVDGARAAGCE